MLSIHARRDLVVPTQCAIVGYVHVWKDTMGILISVVVLNVYTTQTARRTKAVKGINVLIRVLELVA